MMETKRQFLVGVRSWITLCSTLLLFFGQCALAQIRYSVPEEVKDGTVVGNVAKDLGLDIASLGERRFRISETKDVIFAVNADNGALYVHGRIDREQLCQGSGTCLMELKVLVENPLEVHYVVVEITDVNDHAPIFPQRNETIEIAEQSLPGKRFQLHPARDPDAGINSIRTYTLSANEHFDVNVRESDLSKTPFLVLKKPLDREQSKAHHLLLTAVDGGKPRRSGTLNVTVIVLDSNDNRPVFTQEVYEISLPENVEIGTVVIALTATDADDGINGEIEYSLRESLIQGVKNVFKIDKISGEITMKASVNFEETDQYELDVEASDKGTPPLTGECRVVIKIIDVNDNSPEIDMTSLSNTVSEDSKPGTVISLISVTDKDSGVNGKIIAHITNNVPFELKPSYKENTYSVVTKDFLDREEVSNYDITIKATDCGEPPLSTTKTLSIQILDVNDNSPQFEQSPLYFYIVENNVSGTSLFCVTASDKDKNENADISYSIARTGQEKDVALFLNVNAENGQITALKSFDFETLKSFQFQVVASDSGTPSLSSNVTVHVFILDQNDNAPVILYPVSSNGSAEGVEEIPRNVNAGHLVTKVRAYDADIGYNGWLLFSLQQVTDHSLFGLDRYTGQIRTLRSLTETDEAEHKLVILVKDNGNVSLSATATVLVKVVEPREAFAASDVKSSTKDSEDTNVTFYLMITLASVSALFIISIIVLIAMQCSKSSTDYTSKYLQDTNYDGTLCHSIQYRSGDKRYMLVGPRMSVGSTIVPGSQANTLVLPDRRRPSEEVRQQHNNSFFEILQLLYIMDDSSCRLILK
ncbi:protocadherin alpha-2-like [Periophthalmus magnuspinnatus]|uniref:protocadherin alpha-2-like n=1 Tax=Periophthalmus magnuspinnatus TaxID=409849 RepID=UPI002436FF12|nr:protocadherin alpha-2-like [Periophthalmus magnuspinnatus]